MGLTIKPEWIDIKVSKRIDGKGMISVDFKKLKEEDYLLIYNMGFQEYFNNTTHKVSKYKGVKNNKKQS